LQLFISVSERHVQRDKRLGWYTVQAQSAENYCVSLVRFDVR